MAVIRTVKAPLRIQTRSKPGLAPKLITSHGVLFECDCLELFGRVRSESIDTLFADPPFNLGKDYGIGSSFDRLAERDYLLWCRDWITESVRVLKPGGSIFIYILPRWGYHFATYLEELGMEFRHWIALSMKGTFPRGNKLYPAHYALLYFTKGTPKTFNKLRLPVPQCRHCKKDIKDYGGHRKHLNPEGLNLTDFWEDTAPSRHGKFKSRWHINELKPMIPARCFELSTSQDDVVMDPFGGGGSSYEAAQTLDRFWLGSELTTGDAIVQRFVDKLSQSISKTPPKQVRAVFKENASCL
jgi:site-specific DNA-methyltransferase (adenine-specific)